MRFFDPELLNGPAGDPALYVELVGEGRSLLFDCGKLGRLRPQCALRITDLFLSHTHIDHFIGFDSLLRMLLGSERHLRIFGPPGVIENVQGRLGGYTWNLVDGQKLTVEAWEIQGPVLRHKVFHCAEAFSPHRAVEEEALGPGGLILDDGVVELRCAALDHIIPSLAYAVTERPRINVDEEVLSLDSLERGPWLRKLKEKVRAGEPDHTAILTPAGSKPLGDLRDRYLRIQPGEKLSYVADCLFSEENLDKVLPLVHGSDLLFCEGGFLTADEEKARAARHLTAAQAGEIARRADCADFVIFHFSPKYIDRFDELRRESRASFAGEA